MNERTQGYYAALAPHYDGLPHHRPAPVESVTRAIVRALQLGEEDLLVDLCCGTGLFCREIVRQQPLRFQILAVDGSQAMLDRFCARADAGIRPVAMDATAFAAYPVRCDKILIKDAVGDFPDVGDLFRRIRERLVPAGRLLVAETAPESQTPLFKEARRRWEALALRSDEIAGLVERAGFRVARGTLRVAHRLAKRELLEMVQKRYVPVLATFDDAELQAGIDEMRERFADGDSIELPQRFDFVIGFGA